MKKSHSFMFVKSFACLVAFSVASCSTGGNNAQQYQDSPEGNPIVYKSEAVAYPYFSKLKNTVWVPVYIEGQSADIRTPKDGDKFLVFLRFDDKCRVNGNSGVNLFGGNPTISKSGEFNAGGFFSTRMAGPNHKYESLFLKALDADSITVNGDVLCFFKKGAKTAEFRRAKDGEVCAGK